MIGRVVWEGEEAVPNSSKMYNEKGGENRYLLAIFALFSTVTVFSTASGSYQKPETIGTQGIPKDYEDCLVPPVTFSKIQKSKKWDAVIQEYQWFSSKCH